MYVGVCVCVCLPKLGVETTTGPLVSFNKVKMFA